VSRSLADLTSRDKEVDSNFLDDAFKAATVIMQPFDASKLQMAVSAMEVSKPSSTSYTMKALWSCARGPSAEAKSTSTVYSDVPLGFRNATGTTDGTKSYHMHIEVKLPYTPMFGTAISGTINLSESTPWPIRVDGAVRLKDNLCPAAA
jgi:Flp pilus assembly protein TadG